MIKSLNAFRFIFAISIFFHHFEFKNGSLFYEGGDLAVAFFFILSGFILTYSYETRFSKAQITNKQFILKRISRIYPIHIFTFIAALCIYLFTIFIKIEEFNFNYLLKGGVNILLMQSWIPNEGVYFSYNTVSWYLSNTLFFYFMFSVLLKILVREKYSKILIFSCITLVLYFTAVILVPEKYKIWFFYVNPLVRLIDFIFGILLCRIYNDFISKIVIRNNVMMSIIEILSILTIIGLVFVIRKYPHIMIYSVIYWIPICFLIFTFVLSSKTISNGIVSKFLSNKIFVYLGNISLSFFMVHLLVINALSIVADYLNFDINNYMGLIIAFILSFLSAIFCYHHIEKPSGKFLDSIIIKKLEYKLVV